MRISLTAPDFVETIKQWQQKRQIISGLPAQATMQWSGSTHGIDSITIAFQIFVVTFLEFNVFLTLTILVVPTLKKVKAVLIFSQHMHCVWFGIRSMQCEIHIIIFLLGVHVTSNPFINK